MIGGSANIMEAAAGMLGTVTLQTESEPSRSEVVTQANDSVGIKEKITTTLQIKSRFRRLKKRCKSRASSIL